MHFFTTVTALLGAASVTEAFCLTGIGAQRKTNVRNKFSAAKIIPGPVAQSWNPVVNVLANYNGKQVNLGTEFSPAETGMAPQVRYSAEPGFDPAKTNYTVLLVDPDAPSPNAPALRFFLHQVQYNTHPNCISGAVVASPAGTNGENSVPYMLLTPASVAKHRYIFLVYRQPNGNEPKTNLVDKTARAPFDLAKFVRDNRLTLVGGNFLTEGLESVGARSVERFEGLEMEEEA